MDHETTASYSITVTASDPDNLSADITVTINVTDVNEAPNNATATRAIAENSPAGTAVGAAITTTDPDGDTLSYALTSNEFAINASTGQITVKSGASLDYETTASYSITVTASDPDNLSADITVTINVTDVNEAPVFTDGDTTTRTIYVNANPGDHVGQPVAATDADGDTLIYEIMAGGDSRFENVGQNSNQLSYTGSPALGAVGTKYTLTLRVLDPNGGLDTITVTIEVVAVPMPMPTPTNTPAPAPTNTPAPAPTNTPVPNRKPVFPPGPITREVVFEAPQGTNVAAPVTATDPDGDTLTYAIVGSSGPVNNNFQINSSTGQITVKKQPKLTLALGSYGHKSAKVQATDSQGNSSVVELIIKVVAAPTPTPTPVPTATPSSATATRSVAENSPAGTNVGAPITPITTAGGPLTYALTSNEFAINASTGQLTVKSGANLDYETKQTYSVTVVATGPSTSTNPKGRQANITVTINLTDVNEAPNSAAATRSIAENAAAGTKVGAPVTTTDPDGNGLVYSLTSNEFEIDPQGVAGAASGQIVVKAGATLDYETTQTYTVTLVASDGQLTTDIPVTITVTDVNEPPVANDVTRSVPENAAAGTKVGAPVRAIDPEGDSLIYSLTSNEFEIDPQGNIGAASGQIVVKAGATLDYETKSSYSLTVQASTGDHTTAFTVTVNLTDVNEAPDGSATTRTVAENAAAGTKVGAPVTTTDSDGDSLSYSLTSNEFEIDPQGVVGAASGQIVVKAGATLDYETKSAYNVTVKASDGTNTTDIAVTINLADVNEPPAAAPQTRDVAENSPAGTTVGQPVTATDPEGSPLTYALTSNEFAVGRLTGQLTVKSGASLDYETTSVYSVTVQASDGANTTDIPVTINVTDVNEAPVAAPQTRTVAENSPAGTTVGAPVTASDPDGDTLAYALTSNEFEIDPQGVVGAASGQIVVKAGANLDYETKSVYSVTVQASDGANTTNIAVTINLTDVPETTPTPPGATPVPTAPTPTPPAATPVPTPPTPTPPAATPVPTTPTPTPIPNEAPRFGSATATRSVAENSPAGTTVGAPVTANRPGR